MVRFIELLDFGHNGASPVGLLASKMSLKILLLVYSAEVKDYLTIVPWKALELVMSGEHHNDIGLIVCLLIGGELKLLVFLYIRLYDEDVGIIAHEHHLTYDIL